MYFWFVILLGGHPWLCDVEHITRCLSACFCICSVGTLLSILQSSENSMKQ